ncbi:hypothetical protein ACLMJK_001703 [Lecanora helva]
MTRHNRSDAVGFCAKDKSSGLSAMNRVHPTNESYDHSYLGVVKGEDAVVRRDFAYIKSEPREETIDMATIPLHDPANNLNGQSFDQENDVTQQGTTSIKADKVDGKTYFPDSIPMKSVWRTVKAHLDAQLDKMEAIEVEIEVLRSEFKTINKNYAELGERMNRLLERQHELQEEEEQMHQGPGLS